MKAQTISSLLKASIPPKGDKRVDLDTIKSNQMLAQVIETIPARIFWKDRDSRYLGCNTLFAKDAGKEKPNDLIGLTDYEMGWKDQADLYRKDDAAVMNSGKSKIKYEEPQSTPDGGTIWLETSKIPLKNSDNKVIGILGTYTDITQRKNTEESLRNKEKLLNETQKIAGLGSYSLNIPKGKVGPYRFS